MVALHSEFLIGLAHLRVQVARIMEEKLYLIDEIIDLGNILISEID